MAFLHALRRSTTTQHLAVTLAAAHALMLRHRSEHAYCMEDPYISSLVGVKRKHNIPFWEKSLASFDKWNRRDPLLGEKLQLSIPPPMATPKPTRDPGTGTENLSLSNPFHPIRRIAWPKQAISFELERQVEVRKWKIIIEAVGPTRCNLGQNLKGRSEDEKWKILLAVFHTKAPATLRKHAGAISLYMRWCQTSSIDPFPFSEQTSWNYCSFLFESCAPATRADSFVKAARATIQLLSMNCCNYETDSARIKGAILQSIDTKRLLQRASPLSTLAVEIIEDTIFDKSSPLSRRIIAGFVRFCIGARLRHSDATRIDVEPIIDDVRSNPGNANSDEDEYDNAMLGFVATTGSITKTSQTKAKRRKGTPMVAHAWGLKRRNWARQWLRLRQQAGLYAPTDATLMPACGPDWQLVPGTRMTSDTITIIVREILQEQNVTLQEAKRFTSHSMKTTFLSWAGKAGLNKGLRRTLGGHSKSKDNMVDHYSRDELAEPLRQMGFVLAWIMEGKFIPDSTQSGRWTSRPGEPSSIQQGHASAGAYLDAMTRGNSTLPTRSIPDLEEPEEEVEFPASDLEEAEAEDDSRDALQERAAEVHVEEVYSRPENKTRTEGGNTIRFTPSMPDIQFTVIRHLFHGTRHWCVKGKHVICQQGLLPDYDESKYGLATTHSDAFCFDCLRAATDDYNITSPERFVHGEVQPIPAAIAVPEEEPPRAATTTDEPPHDEADDEIRTPRPRSVSPVRIQPKRQCRKR